MISWYTRIYDSTLLETAELFFIFIFLQLVSLREVKAQVNCIYIYTYTCKCVESSHDSKLWFKPFFLLLLLLFFCFLCNPFWIVFCPNNQTGCVCVHHTPVINSDLEYCSISSSFKSIKQWPGSGGTWPFNPRTQEAEAEVGGSL